MTRFYVDSLIIKKYDGEVKCDSRILGNERTSRKNPASIRILENTLYIRKILRCIGSKKMV